MVRLRLRGDFGADVLFTASKHVNDGFKRKIQETILEPDKTFKV